MKLITITTTFVAVIAGGLFLAYRMGYEDARARFEFKEGV